MKLIIEIDDYIAKGIRGENECEVEPRAIVRSFQATIADAIENGTPYNPTGDCISRSVLDEIRQLYKKYQPNLATEVIEFGNALEKLIDNAQAVDLWQMRQEATENALKKAEVLYGRPQGEWKFNERGSFYCSVCNGEPYDQYATTAFCPFCGADMRKGGAE